MSESYGSGLTRRSVLAGGISALLTGCISARHLAQRDFADEVRTIEARLGGRIGVYVIDTADGGTLGHREHERFAMCSTFKTLLAACVLAKAEAGALSLERQILIEQRDMISHAPVTSRMAGKGSLNVRELCAAIVQVSDNPAANLLLRLVGGPEELTRFLRQIGDRVTRLDRYELDLNTNLRGDPRDTTTSSAMAATVRKLVLGDVLQEPARALLTHWLITSTTGLQRIRAGLPPTWRAGDKTGTGANGAVNDVAILWPPDRAPLVAAIYMSESAQSRDVLEQAHAQIARLIGEWSSPEARG